MSHFLWCIRLVKPPPSNPLSNRCYCLCNVLCCLLCIFPNGWCFLNLLAFFLLAYVSMLITVDSLHLSLILFIRGKKGYVFSIFHGKPNNKGKNSIHSRVSIQISVFLLVVLSSLTHHLNIRRHSGEKVKKLVVVNQVRIAELLGELIHACGGKKRNHFRVSTHSVWPAVGIKARLTPHQHKISKRYEVEQNCGRT